MIYAFNSVPNYRKDAIMYSLRNEKMARFGWSNKDEHNLEIHPENGREYGTKFLLDINSGDYIVYINLPKYGECTCVKVVGSYQWRNPQDSDFNHCIPIDAGSIFTFNRNDKSVSPQLSSRLKLQGRYWRIYCEEDFYELLKLSNSADYEKGKRSIEDNASYFLARAENVFDSLAEHLQIAYPSFDLEQLLLRIFEKTGKYESVISKHGVGDHGADIILTSAPFYGTPYTSCCLVQVKSYRGKMDTEKAVNDVRRAVQYYGKSKDNFNVQCALIVTTATEISAQVRTRIDELSNELHLPIGILFGAELVRFVLKYL